MYKELTDAQFSIIRGGLLERLLILLRIKTAEKPHTMRKIFFFTLIGWTPLLLLSAAEGLLWGEKAQVTFLEEFATHIRFLIAIPIMMVSEVLVDKRVKSVVNQFTYSELVADAGKKQFELAKRKADNMCDSPWAEAIILILIISNVVFRINANSTGFTSWVFPYEDRPHELSLAGYWAASISFPFFQFLLLRWLWRWIIWFRLLLLISKADLHLLPTHPDRAGGLGFLGERPVVFGPITFMLGVVFAAIIGERVFYLNARLQEYYPLIIAFAILAVIINVVPLLSFIPPINRFRQEGITNYGALIAFHHRNFEKKWVENTSEKKSLLGSDDVSSASDIGMLYEAIIKMNPFPFDIRIAVASIIISLLPLLPVLALQMPIAEIFQLLAGILL
jgi:hypothetical protein